MNYKNVGLIYLLCSVYYVVAEFISAVFFNDSLLNTYLFHTISELGIPNMNSPLSILMNSAFILMGLSLIYVNFAEFKNYIVKNRILFYILTLISSIGVIIVGFIHGGNPLTSGYHTMGAVMSIMGGNLLLILISKSMEDFEEFQKVSCILGLIGLISFVILFFNMSNVIMPVFERISVYTMILWTFLAGRFLLKN